MNSGLRLLRLIELTSFIRPLLPKVLHTLERPGSGLIGAGGMFKTLQVIDEEDSISVAHPSQSPDLDEQSPPANILRHTEPTDDSDDHFDYQRRILLGCETSVKSLKVLLDIDPESGQIRDIISTDHSRVAELGLNRSVAVPAQCDGQREEYISGKREPRITDTRQTSSKTPRNHAVNPPILSVSNHRSQSTPRRKAATLIAMSLRDFIMPDSDTDEVGDSEDEWLQEVLLDSHQKRYRSSGRSNSSPTGHFPTQHQQHQDRYRGYRSPNIQDQRRQFQAQIEQIEDAEDLRRLYPPSLQPEVSNMVEQYFSIESDVLSRILPTADRVAAQVTDLELHEFTLSSQIQTTGKGLGGQMESLYTIVWDLFKMKRTSFCAEGIVKHQNGQENVYAMVITGVQIERLDDPSVATTVGHIFIQTQESQRRNTRYRLMLPSQAYEELWQAFAWLSDFGKHVFHYLAASNQRSIEINLKHFQQDFWRFICEFHSRDQVTINEWYSLCGRPDDFRRFIVRFGTFLHVQAQSVSANSDWYDDLFTHPVWAEVDKSGAKVKKVPYESEKTSVTPNVAKVFLEAFSLWGSGEGNLDLLDVLTIDPEVEAEQNRRIDCLRFPHKLQHSNAHGFSVIDGRKVSRAALTLQEVSIAWSRRDWEIPGFVPDQVLGNVIIIRHGGEYRYAYAVNLGKPGYVNVTWLVLPQADTICGSSTDGSFYPISNELFFSDECGCGQVRSDRILATYPVNIFADHNDAPDGFFVHSLYYKDAQAVVTANPEEVLHGCLQHVQVSRESTPKPTPAEIPKMRTLSLFSGCGLLDHGLESAGPFRTVVAVEVDHTALLSHKANTNHRECQHLHESTNAYLRDICRGKRPLSKVHFIVAGSPCQGFSLLNRSRESEPAHRKCSLCANFCSLVEIFRPEYLLLENVENMDSSDSEKGRPNACSQLICFLVALGYQVRKMILAGADYDAATRRKRLFLVAAAPGLKLPEAPEVVRAIEPTTAFSAIADLDVVHNDQVLNIKEPDHVPFVRLENNFNDNVSKRGIVKAVPKYGLNRNLYGAYEGRHLNPLQEAWYEKQTEEKRKASSAAFRRINPEDLFPTITRAPVPLDARGSGCVHPFQDRIVTLQELRRAQGVPDDFVLIGSVAQSVQQIGNGVVWQVAQALGREIGRAWEASQPMLGYNDGNENGKDRAGRASEKTHTPFQRLDEVPFRPRPGGMSVEQTRPRYRPQTLADPVSNVQGSPFATEVNSPTGLSIRRPEKKPLNRTEPASTSFTPPSHVKRKEMLQTSTKPSGDALTQPLRFGSMLKRQAPTDAVDTEMIREKRKKHFGGRATIDGVDDSDEDDIVFLSARSKKRARPGKVVID